MDGPESLSAARRGKPRMSTPLDIIVPVLMGAALLWWIGRGMGGRSMLIATAVTLAVIVGVLLIQNAGWR
ncbi:MAG TPA: hypothetical protein DEA80_18380 [Afipia sp.]|nr:MAG: hypothetical protein CBB64_20520 [Afipia sp. TMED4]HAO41827.1 hypothetical protein [Afipia sp.]HAP12702.1 hypothetical protein [Afipia sp.]HBF53467.1 hypothetical protein [Afipia sp.]HBR46855.1 hypothetical protein [Afipia sp.]|tara:strand:+ start:130 stop:339 length:210 start_codon:yes stop_codon:yes gene_type:complete